MPLPYQYRDWPLALFMGVAFAIAFLVEYVSVDSRLIEVQFGEPCCAGGDCSVVKVLQNLPSTEEVRHALGPQSSIVSLRTSRSTSPREIWDAIASIRSRPLKMIVDGREFDGRPLN